MYFTQDDYRKIEEWLRARTVKDTQFPDADPLTGVEKVPIIQDGRNKVVDLNTFIKQLSLMELPDFLNVTTFTKKGYLTLEDAISSIPVEQRKLGLTITYHSEKGNWMIYQFKGTSLNQWNSLNYWNSIVEEALAEFVCYPDEEDITGVIEGNRTLLKFKNRDYNPAEFSGMGRIILRKNLVGTEACSIDDEDHFNNILIQDMIREENTVYIVQYDFDLDGKIISVPKGCTLWFQGGSINNGTIYLQETAILGAFEFADMGNAKLFGKFNTGQIMTFSNDSYKAKEGEYFIPSTKPSSATPQEDAKQDREVFYDENSDAYTDRQRQELRWWNGEEWLLMLDITDYNEIKSIIDDIIEKHNTEMSACYKYFKARCYALELRMDEAENRLDEHDTILENHETRITVIEGDIVNINQEITNIHTDITNIEGDISNIETNITDITNNINDITQNISNITDVINNLDEIINNNIQQFIETNIVGVSSVTVNGTRYEPDSNGNITLPDYPEAGGGTADKTRGTLTFTGASNATFDGSSDVTVNIPEGGSGSGGGGGQADSVKGTLTVKSSSGDTLVTYNGSEDKTLTLPSSEGGGGGTVDRVAHKLKFTGASTAEYDGSEEVTVNIPTGGSTGGGGSNQPLIFKGAVNETYDGSVQKEVIIPTFADMDTKPFVMKNASGEEVISYNAKEAKEVQLKKLHVQTNYSNSNSLPSGIMDTPLSGSLVPYDIDLLKEEGVINLTRCNFGTINNGIVLVSGYIRRLSNSSGWYFHSVHRHPFITAVVSSEGQAAVKIAVSSAGGSVSVHSATVSYSDSTDKDISDIDWGRYRSSVVGLRCGISGSDIYVQGIRTADKNNDSIDFDPASDSGKLLGFNIIIIGHIDS